MHETPECIFKRKEDLHESINVHKRCEEPWKGRWKRIRDIVIKSSATISYQYARHGLDHRCLLTCQHSGTFDTGFGNIQRLLG